MQGSRGNELGSYGLTGRFPDHARPVHLAIGALRKEIGRWSSGDLPWSPDAWVLQSMLSGPVWRYERWADVSKEILAVALVGQ
jgi:hypothetical protein